jgi:hypothetical protein
MPVQVRDARGHFMDPRIQYAKSANWVSIAFWTLGEGMPLVWMPVMADSHVQWGRSGRKV